VLNKVAVDPEKVCQTWTMTPCSDSGGTSIKKAGVSVGSGVGLVGIEEAVPISDVMGPSIMDAQAVRIRMSMQIVIKRWLVFMV
jgi:hypothetical protein